MDRRAWALLDEFTAFQRRVALGCLRRLRPAAGLRLLLQGMEFYRCWEFPLAYLDLAPRPGQRFLDAGSSKSLFPLFLALRGVEAHAVDCDERVHWQADYARAIGRGDLVGRGLCLRTGDATANPQPDGYFDLVSAISAVEHFTGEGDTAFVGEARRLLKPGGRLYLSFGLSETYEEGRWHTLFNRRYDEAALRRRILGPSGMVLERRRFFEGPRMQAFTRRWFRLPAWIRNGALGALQQPLFRWLQSRDDARAENARYVSLLLRK